MSRTYATRVSRVEDLNLWKQSCSPIIILLFYYHNSNLIIILLSQNIKKLSAFQYYFAVLSNSTRIFSICRLRVRRLHFFTFTNYRLIRKFQDITACNNSLSKYNLVKRYKLFQTPSTACENFPHTSSISIGTLNYVYLMCWYFLGFRDSKKTETKWRNRKFGDVHRAINFTLVNHSLCLNFFVGTCRYFSIQGNGKLVTLNYFFVNKISTEFQGVVELSWYYFNN